MIGWRVYGVGIVLLALVGLTLRDFLPGQPAPKSLPDRALLAYAANGFTLLAGLSMQWRRAKPYAAGALTAYYAFVVVVLMNGRVVLAHLTTVGAYSGTAEQLAITAGGLIVYAASAKIDAALAVRLTRLGQIVFGVCALLFGTAHFTYMNLTVPMVPKWLPPKPEFWAVATGLFHIAAGLAILTGVQARLAAVLLTVMFAAFTPLVHLPMLLAAPMSDTNWSENALNLALTGVAWVVAESLVRQAEGSAQRHAISPEHRIVTPSREQPL